MIGQRIKNKRLELGLSQEDLAKLTGYDNRASISKIESGIIDINVSKVKVFAEALKVTESYLMGWEEDPTPKENLSPRTVILAREAGTLTEEQIEFVEGLIKQFKDKNGIE